MTSWKDIRAGWPADWEKAYADAQERYADSVLADARKFGPVVEAVLQHLQISRMNLDRILALGQKEGLSGEEHETLEILEEAYYRIAAGIYADAQPARPPVPKLEGTSAVHSIGFLPLVLPVTALAIKLAKRGKKNREAEPPEVGVAPAVVLLVLGLGLTVAAVAWAIVAFTYVVKLATDTALLRAELEARIDASRSGRTLQPSTLPASPPSGGQGYGAFLALAAFLGLLGAGYAWTRR